MPLPLYERFAQVMEHLCRHDGDGGHGYTWDARWGDGTYETVTLSDGSEAQVANGDRDCSSGIISALKAVGVDVHGATYTGNMRSCLMKTGLFEWVPMAVNRPAKRGDIYLNEASHTAMCTNDSPDMLCQFSINEKGTVHGGRKGDQTARESNFRAYYSYPWHGRLCWKDRGGTAVVSKPATNTPPAAAGDLEVDGYWGRLTTAALQRALGTPVDGIVSDQYVGYKANNPGLDSGSWEWHRSTREGSVVVRALQRKVGARVDGIAGDETFSKLQACLGTPVDGVISSPSSCVKELQRRLNAGIF
ncbi:peptidoglycan-binding protein [Adlercreutzia sp. ZJ242]|uniref:peptidoglycan-binding domain-containing protein n=1 Tax=Adlercreutzia sp. ZJ242 TaxID=2709409 RepID=UPI0013ED92B3|nr:hypothetical protein [Adlercreutzia sp. ZJ242]